MSQVTKCCLVSGFLGQLQQWVWFPHYQRRMWQVLLQGFGVQEYLSVFRCISCFFLKCFMVSNEGSITHNQLLYFMRTCTATFPGPPGRPHFTENSSACPLGDIALNLPKGISASSFRPTLGHLDAKYFATNMGVSMVVMVLFAGQSTVYQMWPEFNGWIYPQGSWGLVVVFLLLLSHHEIDFLLLWCHIWPSMG
jgi:hypothetical protein